MNIHTSNVPPQAQALLAGRTKVSTYESTGGEVTAAFAAHNLSLLPPIPAGSVIHDNACGSGTVSRVLLASPPTTTPTPADLQIHATDIDEAFLDVLRADAAQHAWPIAVSSQKSEATSFAADTFDYSITNVALFFTSNAGLDGAREIHRTLKPGGTAVVNCWKQVTWLMPVMAVHKATRPGTPFPTPVVAWHDGQQIQKVMREAGFREEDISLDSSETWAKVPKEELRTWAEKTWSYLGGIGGWSDGDEDKWDEAVDLLTKLLVEQPGTKIEGDEVWMKASQWVVIAKKA
jgi:SAM-dependent methyltransferase